jgi:plastocyanin
MRSRAGFGVALCATVIGVVLPTGAASAATKTVTAGPPGMGAAKRLLGTAFLKKYSPDVNDFFLHRVTINQGDTISFRINGFHNIDLPGSSGRDLPLIVSGATVSGDTDFAGNPFWFNGHVKSLGFNPALLSKIGGSTYNGSNRVDSGIPAGSGNPPPFPVKFTKAGTYKYFCDVHPGMIGYVVVRPKGKSVPTAAQDSAARTSQVNTDIAAIKAAAKLKPSGNRVSLGSAGPNGIEDFAMFPSRLSVRVGATVTFSMPPDSREVHTATFGPSAYLMAAANSITSPAPEQQVWYPSDPGRVTLAGSQTHGNGFANTGALDSDPTTLQPSSGKIKFTKAGNYHYICLIHAFMQGTIVVH